MDRHLRSDGGQGKKEGPVLSPGPGRKSQGARVPRKNESMTPNLASQRMGYQTTTGNFEGKDSNKEAIPQRCHLLTYKTGTAVTKAPPSSRRGFITKNETVSRQRACFYNDTENRRRKERGTNTFIRRTGSIKGKCYFLREEKDGPRGRGWGINWRIPCFETKGRIMVLPLSVNKARGQRVAFGKKSQESERKLGKKKKEGPGPSRGFQEKVKSVRGGKALVSPIISTIKGGRAKGRTRFHQRNLTSRLYLREPFAEREKEKGRRVLVEKLSGKRSACQKGRRRPS